ncbi:MAG: M42 family metallopeptidase [Chloroflexota bacterium]|nr:M42 family metallopeptidase [Chloroflexota bacterium]
MKDLIKTLVETYGPSGNEEQIRGLIEETISDHVEEIQVDTMGNLIAHKEGTGDGKRVMIAAHMDEIGLVVTHIDDDGFARFGRVGGVSPITLVGNRVLFADSTTGVIGCEKWLRSSKLPEWEELFIDVGATSQKDCPIDVGNIAGFVRSFVDMGKRMVAKSMDDRVGCAVVIQTLLNMEDSPNDVYFVFTVQEELGTRGATAATFGIEPDVAVAVDVTSVGDTPEAHPMAVSLGDGPAIKVMDSGMLTHPGVKRWMIEAAEDADIPYQLEVLERGSTDARAMQLSRIGVAAGCLSIPCRYVHTPSEMVDYGDVQGSVDLLSAMLGGEIDLS